MTNKEIYLDNSATSPLLPEVWDKMHEICRHDFGNPSSLHKKGIKAKRHLNRSKEIIAGSLGVKAEEIFFTSGGTEANNLALLGCAKRRKKLGRHIVASAIEHPSVLEPLKHLENEGFDVTYLKPDKAGYISPRHVLDAIRDDTILVAVMHVNNEMGAILPVEEIGKELKKKNSRIHFHVDAVQSFARLKVKPREWGIDSLALSGHKIHGPKGVGALYLGNSEHIRPLVFGGGQEGGLRPGTENIPGIVGLAAATEAVIPLAAQNWDKMKEMKNLAVEKTLSSLPQAIYNGPEPGKNDVPYIINFSFPGLKGEVLIHALEENNIYASTGSACHSKHPEPSHVLLAMGIPVKAVEGALRLSFSPDTQENDLLLAVNTMIEKVKDLSFFIVRG